MLLYRLPEAQLVKLINPFLLDPKELGGLGLTTGQVGLVYGTIGILGLTIGGIIGGIVAAKGGLKNGFGLWLGVFPSPALHSFTSAITNPIACSSSTSAFYRTIRLWIWIHSLYAVFDLLLRRGT